MSRRIKGAGGGPHRSLSTTDWLTEIFGYLTTPTIGVGGNGGVGGGQAAVRFPDTVVFKYERPYVWFAHAPHGVVVRETHKEIGAKAALQAKPKKRADPKDPPG